MCTNMKANVLLTFFFFFFPGREKKNILLTKRSKKDLNDLSVSRSVMSQKQNYTATTQRKQTEQIPLTQMKRDSINVLMFLPVSGMAWTQLPSLLLGTMQDIFGRMCP